METLTKRTSKDIVAAEWTAKIGEALGKGLLAGAVGTAAITSSQMVEMKIDGRKPSMAPEQAAEKVFDIQPKSEDAKEKINHQMHWAYGISWGIPRAVLSLAGIKGPVATAIHFAAVWGTAMVMLPSMKLSKPVTEWKPKEIAIDAFHHAIYATAAGLLIDTLFSKK